MQKRKKSIDISLIIVAITAFFYYIIGNGYFLLIAAVAPVILTIFKKHIVFDIEDFWWVVFVLLAIISLFFTSGLSGPIRFIFVITVLLVLKLIYEDIYGWQNLISRVFFIFSIVHVVAVLLSIITPDLILSIAKALYSGETYITYISLFELGSYAGITGQTGIAAFYISIFIAFIIGRLFRGEKTTANLLLLFVGAVALFLTQKRSFLVANVVAVIIVFLIDNRNDKKKIKRIITAGVIGIITYVALTYIPETQGILEKINALSETDITNGRKILWEDTIEIWKQSPMFGVGAGSLVSQYDMSSHNVFIQILAEMGALGLMAYIMMLCTAFSQSLKGYKDVISDRTLNVITKANYSAAIYMQIVYIVYSFFGNPLYGISFVLPYVVFVTQFKSYNRNSMKRQKVIG